MSDTLSTKEAGTETGTELRSASKWRTTLGSVCLGVAFALCAAAYAQRPKAPVLLLGNSPAPSSNILFRETFESMPTGPYQPVSGKWTRGDNPTGCCSIQNSNPVFAGSGKYFRPGPVEWKSDGSVFRTEYWYVGTPYQNPRVSMISLGQGHYQAPQDYWYGYVFCLDRYSKPTGQPTFDVPRVHFNQFHDDAGPGTADVNPMVSLFGDDEHIIGYIESSDEPDGGVSGSSVYTGNLYPGWKPGTCINVIWNVFFDTRTRAQGSKGFIRLWLGDDSTPRWEWINKQVSMPVAKGGDGYMPYFNLGGYLSGWRWTPNAAGMTYEARFDNFTVMDSTGSWAAMRTALKNPN